METLKHFNNFVNEILVDNSRTYKSSILKKYSSDNIIKRYLNFIYNPYIITGISDKKLNKQIDNTLNYIDIESMFNLLNYLEKHNTGNSNDILTVQKYLDTLDVELLNIAKNIILKNIQLGVDAKTINSCIPNLIPTFSVQLANKYFDKPEIVEGKEFALTTKIDGGRIIAMKENGIVSFYTRAGQKYEGLVDLEKEMSLYMPDNIALDGEITLLDKGKLSSKEQYKQTMMITRKDGEKHGVKMLVFDCMSSEEFMHQNCPLTYTQRRTNLNNIFLNYEFKYFNILPILYQGDDTSEITKWLNHNIKNGEEGVMINLTDALYCFNRTNNLLKVKKMNDMDLTVIGFEEGCNRHKGSLGALIVDYDGNKLKVGSGFSDELRKNIWSHQDEWINRVIVVQYFEKTENQKGGQSLRFPVYLDYRTDK